MSLIAVISQAALAAGLSPALLLSVCFYESSLKNTIVPHDGHSASYGICQVKLRTAKEVEPDIYPSHLMRPATNARIAAKYLAKQIVRYGGCIQCGIDAYNKGHFVSRNSQYVKRVLKHMKAETWKSL